MTIPLACLLAFAVWTLTLLGLSVGVYRWSQVLSGRATIRQWRGDRPEGPAWYRRALRAHANCVENLPVFGAITVSAHLSGISGAAMDGLALMVIGARVSHSLVHIIPRQTEFVAAARFGLFFVQVLAMLAMAGLVVLQPVPRTAGPCPVPDMRRLLPAALARVCRHGTRAVFCPVAGLGETYTRSANA